MLTRKRDKVRCTRAEGPDKRGRYHFTLEWISNGRKRAQCFFSDPKKYGEDVEKAVTAAGKPDRAALLRKRLGLQIVQSNCPQKTS